MYVAGDEINGEMQFGRYYRTVELYVIIKNIICKAAIVILTGGLLCGCARQSDMPKQDNQSEQVGTSGQTGQFELDILSEQADMSEQAGQSEQTSQLNEIEDQVQLQEEEILKNVDESEVEGKSNITIRMVGDVLLHTPVEDAACSDEDGTYDFSYIFQNTRDLIEEADVAMVNQEVIIGGEELGISGYPAFNAPTAVGDALVDAGFDVILHATNHALDKGKRGLLNCLDFWNSTYPDITVLGIHDFQEEHSAVSFIDINDITIAVLNYTYGTNGIPLPEDMPYAVDMLVEDVVTSDINYAKEHSDFIIVAPHWGTEYRLEPDSYQDKWTDVFLHNGVNLVIGTHPHVIEPIELITDEENDQEMLVYYSLGNYVNWTSGTGDGIANRMVGGMADIELSVEMSQDGLDKKVSIADYGVTALITDLRAGDNGVTVYKLSEYNEAMAKNNEIIKQDSKFSYEYCVNLCNQIWGEDWR